MSQRSLKFHIKSNDYFGTLATIISLVRQNLEKKESGSAHILKKLENDLVYLQENYKIVKK